MNSPLQIVLIFSLFQVHLAFSSKILIDNSNSPSLLLSDDDPTVTDLLNDGTRNNSTLISEVNSSNLPEGESRIHEQIDAPVSSDDSSNGSNGQESEDDIKAKESSKWNVSKPLPKQASEPNWSSDTGCHEEEAILKECKRRLNRGKIQKDASSPASGSSSTSNNPSSPASAIRKYL